MRTILHIDFNSYFATVEQQANPKLRGKPIGVTGGDRIKRTVLGAASIEAKKFGVKTGMQIWEAKKLCPDIILVQGDSDKYLETTKRFLNILKDYSPYVEVFSIDEVFMQISPTVIASPEGAWQSNLEIASSFTLLAMTTAATIKSRIRTEIGEWMKVSIGISYNKLLAKLASNLQKPDGLVVIANQEEAIKILDKIELDEICGIGRRIKKRLNNMGIFNFYQLRKIPLDILLASFKSYGRILYNYARGIDNNPVIPFYEKEEVKSIGHRHTIDHDTSEVQEIKQILLKLTELIARRLRVKKLVGKTVHCWYRKALNVIPSATRDLKINLEIPHYVRNDKMSFTGEGMQATILYTNDGLEIFKAAWKIFNIIWDSGKIRMVGVSISNLKPLNPQNLSLLPESNRQAVIIQTLDQINDKYGEFTLQRGILLNSSPMSRKPNPYLADRRFKI